jgi:hypothetical protein
MMKRNAKLWLSAGLVAAMAAAGSAMAADNPPAAPADTDTEQQVQSALQAVPGAGPQFGKGKGMGQGQGRMGQGKMGQGMANTQGQFPGQGRGMHRMEGNAQLLSLLKIDQATLQKERQSGKSLVEIAKEKGVSEQQVMDAVIEQRTANIDAAAAAGRMTKERADELKAAMTEQVKQMVNSKDCIPGSNGMRLGQPNNPQQQ